MKNIILTTDSYKVTHWKQYPPGTQHVYSYLESRGGDPTIFFGLQYLLKKHLLNPGLSTQAIHEADDFYRKHFGSGLMNLDGWLRLYAKWGNSLPLEIKAVPEGSVVLPSNVLMTIENSDPEFYWLTNWVETILLHVWYPTSVATRSHNYKQAWFDALTRSGSTAGLDFKVHDFGYRGSTSDESAGIGGCAHLVNFQGTDNVAGLLVAQEYYACDMAGFSIPASEHSTITGWGELREELAYENMLDQFPEGMVAVVSDSYDIYNAVINLWGDKLRKKVQSRNGTVIIRPDSGELPGTVLQVLDLLGYRFGYDINNQGYKVLPPYIRVIQGDGINETTNKVLLEAILEKGWSAENIAVGSGGGLLQDNITRDTHKFAFKCSAIDTDGEWHDVYKHPVGDSGKHSKRGRLKLINVGGDVYPYYLTTGESDRLDKSDELQTVFWNGSLLVNDSLDTIRDRAFLQSRYDCNID